MTIVKRPEIERALDKAAARCFLLYGPDEAGSRALADRLAQAMGAAAERIDLEGVALAKDPALLADEAAAHSLFDGARFIRVRASGDEVADALEALLAAPQRGNPVAIVAGALKASSRLLKLAAAPDVLAFASYPVDARDAVPLVLGLAQPLGLKLVPDLARRMFDAAAGDRAVIASELEKMASYLDASPDSPRPVDAEALAAIGAGEGESSAGALVDAVLTGATAVAVAELARLREAGEDGVPLVRAALRRLLQLAALRAEADRTSIAAAVAGAGKALFWKEKAIVEAELRRWSSAELARLIEHVTAAQARLLAPATAGPAIAAEALLTVARAAARNRG